MRTKLKPFILAIAATFPLAVVADAGFDDTNDQSQTDKTLAVKNVSYENEYSFMYKDFEVVAPDDGDYYMEFWLIPAEYPDGAYTTFSVFVNDTKVGEITPKTANWQACRVNGNEKVSLYKGINKISIGTLLPEVPNVESVSLALRDEDATISRLAYDQYLAKAEANALETYDSENSYIQAVELDNASSTTFPLKYSFHTLVYRKAGEKLTIKTSSPMCLHKVDVMLYEHSSDFLGEGTSYEPSSEEMQGLSWLGISEIREPKTGPINIPYSVAMEIDAPQTGIYLIRVRSTTSNSSLSKINVNINDTYKYNNVPISFTWYEYTIPAYGKEYVTITHCLDRTNADPFIFVHGNAADRIVGFNNDGPTGIAPNLDMSFTKESRISQIYNIATTGISLMNASSQAPDASMKICEIITQPKTPTIYGLPAQEGENFPNAANLRSTDRTTGISSITDNEVYEVSIFDMSGTLLRSFNPRPDQDIISEMNTGIPTPGIYLIKIESSNGMECRKVIIR